MGAFERHINTKQLCGGKALHILACSHDNVRPDETTIILKTDKHTNISESMMSHLNCIPMHSYSLYQVFNSELKISLWGSNDPFTSVNI